jgi:hypothetical protein
MMAGEPTTVKRGSGHRIRAGSDPDQQRRPGPPPERMREIVTAGSIQTRRSTKSTMPPWRIRSARFEQAPPIARPSPVPASPSWDSGPSSSVRIDAAAASTQTTASKKYCPRPAIQVPETQGLLAGAADAHADRPRGEGISALASYSQDDSLHFLINRDDEPERRRQRDHDTRTLLQVCHVRGPPTAVLSLLPDLVGAATIRAWRPSCTPWFGSPIRRSSSQ